LKTLEDIQKELPEIIRVLSLYRTLMYNQILRLFPDKSDKIDSVLKRLIKQKRIIYDRDDDTLSYGSEANDKNYDYGLISAFWVLLDFLDKVEYHSPSDYPVQVAFFMNCELYEIIYVDDGREVLINHALSSKNPPHMKRIIIVLDEKQISKINVDNTICFCIVGENGDVTYYNVENT